LRGKGVLSKLLTSYDIGCGDCPVLACNFKPASRAKAVEFRENTWAAAEGIYMP
jgi:hypothetical protein